jgi:peptide/nickel transport system substrate-binding protein
MKKNGSKMWIVVAGLIIIVLLLAISGQTQSQVPKRGGVLRVAHTEAPQHFDVHSHVTTMNFSNTIFPCYNTLVEPDKEDTSKIVGDLAENWETPNDVTYVFHLHKGVMFHDGVELTSEDVKFSLDRIRLPLVTPSPRKSTLEAIDKIETLDKYTVKITTKYPSAGFLRSLCQLWMAIMPKHVIEVKGDMKTIVVGTGPFKFQSFKPDVGIVLVRNENYFKKGLPYIDEYRTFIIPDPGSTLEAFILGRIDLSGYPWSTEEQVQRIKREMPGAKLFPITQVSSPQMVLNTGKPPFNDLRVRRAVDLAIDRYDIARVHAVGGVWKGWCPMHDTWWALPQEELEGWPGQRKDKANDITEARSLLAQAGYGPQKPLTFEIMVGQAKALARIHETDDWAVNIKEQLRNSLGVNVEIKSVAYPAPFRDDALAGNYHALLMRYGMTTDDPDALRVLWGPGGSLNYSRFKDTEIADMLLKQSSIMNREERRKVVWDLQRRIIRSSTAFDVYTYIDTTAVAPYVEGYKPDFARNYDRQIKNLETAWLRK